MKRLTTIFFFLAVLSTVARSGSTLFDAFSESGFKFPHLVSEKAPILQFSSETLINIDSQKQSTKQGANYVVNLFPNAKLTDNENQYYLGWVDQYTSSEGTTVLGVNNPELRHKPVFLVSESLKTGLITSVRIPSALSKDFRNFIGTVYDQFAPTFPDPKKYKVSPNISGGAAIITESRDSSVSDDGQLSQNIVLDANNFVITNEIKYTFSLQNINDATIGETQTFKFEGGNIQSNVLVNTKLNLVKQLSPDFAFIEQIQKILETDVTAKTFSREEFDKLISSDFQAEIVGKARDSTVNPTNSLTRALQTVYPIYSKTINLISQNVLGKTLTLQLSVTCSLSAANSSSNPNNTVTCSASLVIAYAGMTKNVQLYSFTKKLVNWSIGTSLGGQWGIGIVIPLPPPVSFIQIALSFNIGYGLGIGVSATLIANNFSAKAYLNTSVTASAEAGIRVGIAEAGVYLGGTIVSIRTEPTLTMILGLNKINGNVLWTLKLNAFSFNWGLYYKWCYFFGCGSRKTITSWIVNQGISSTTTIYSKVFLIWL